MRNRATNIVVLVLLLCSCSRNSDSDIPVSADLPEIPDYFPEFEYPEGNEPSEARLALGKRLFFDPVLSVDSSLSCASCHKPELAFADDVAISPGVKGRLGTRNAPSLGNVAYHPYYTREGGVPTLEMQILVPIQEHAEFDFNIVDISDRLMKNAEYVQMSKEAYNRDIDPFVITRALANYERSLISGRSKYDRYLQTGIKRVLSEEEKRGMYLFFSDRLKCSECHGGFDFTSYDFSNNGLYEEYEDVGRFRLTNEESDLHLFKIPSLRNVGVTPPYMHDGSMQNLEQVIDHYDSGGAGNSQKSELITALNLTSDEKSDLKSFLLTLTDMSFLTNKKFVENEKD